MKIASVYAGKPEKIRGTAYRTESTGRWFMVYI
jgi:hypothetical protein